MTKNKIFGEIKLALRAGHYASLSHREKKIYKNAFKNGYKLAKLHASKSEKLYQPKKIINVSFVKLNHDVFNKIVDMVCQKYSVSKKDLFTKNRSQDLVRVRNILHNILNEKYKMNLTNIGKYFQQDHTTVLHSIRMKFKKERFWDAGQTLWQEYQDLNQEL